jgi:hypothetical protein
MQLPEETHSTKVTTVGKKYKGAARRVNGVSGRPVLEVREVIRQWVGALARSESPRGCA